MDAPRMTRQHFAFVARMLRDIRPCDTSAGVDSVWRTHCENFAYWLSTTNNRFDKARFLRECGIEPETRT